VNRQTLVAQKVDEGAVGPVLEETAHQVGQEILMAPDRIIDAAADAELSVLDDPSP
jgi:hypothetical protein